jgi:hypothetical protein
VLLSLALVLLVAAMVGSPDVVFGGPEAEALPVKAAMSLILMVVRVVSTG